MRRIAIAMVGSAAACIAALWLVGIYAIEVSTFWAAMILVGAAAYFYVRDRPKGPQPLGKCCCRGLDPRPPVARTLSLPNGDQITSIRQSILQAGIDAANERPRR